MSAPVVGSDYYYALERETTFGTLENSAPISIPTENMEIVHDAKSHAVIVSRGKRGQFEDDTWQDTVNAIPTASSSFYMSLGTFDWMPAFLQNSSDWTQTSNDWIFNTKTEIADFPDFSADEGYFYSLTSLDPNAFRDPITSAVCNSLKLSIAPDANDSCLTAEMEWMGQSSAIAISGGVTPSLPSMVGLQKWNNISAVTYAGAIDILSDFISFEITATNGAKFVPAGGSDNIALTGYESTGSITVLYSDEALSAYKLLELVLLNQGPESATHIAIQFGDGATDGDTKVEFSIMVTGKSEDKSEEHTATFDFAGTVSDTFQQEEILQLTIYEDNT